MKSPTIPLADFEDAFETQGVLEAVNQGERGDSPARETFGSHLIAIVAWPGPVFVISMS